MRIEHTILIPLQPVTKKNSMRIVQAGRFPRLLPSKAYEAFEKAAIMYCPALHIEQPIEITVRFYMATRRRVDLTNLLEAIDDVLVKAGTIADDSAIPPHIVSHDGSRVYYDKLNPRIVVSITEWEGEND